MALFLLILIGCSSLPVHKALDRVQVGQDKDQVLEEAGNPSRTFRTQGQDHWVYSYFVDDREMLRQVIFENSRVISVTSEKARGSADPAVAASKESPEEDLEQYEKRVREEQKAKQSNFEDIQEK